MSYFTSGTWAATASYVASAAYAATVTSASYALTSSAATSITFIPATASFATTSSAATSITFTPVSASYAVTSSLSNTTTNLHINQIDYVLNTGSSPLIYEHLIYDGAQISPYIPMAMTVPEMGANWFRATVNNGNIYYLNCTPSTSFISGSGMAGSSYGTESISAGEYIFLNTSITTSASAGIISTASLVNIAQTSSLWIHTYRLPGNNTSNYGGWYGFTNLMVSSSTGSPTGGGSRFIGIYCDMRTFAYTGVAYDGTTKNTTSTIGIGAAGPETFRVRIAGTTAYFSVNNCPEQSCTIPTNVRTGRLGWQVSILNENNNPSNIARADWGWTYCQYGI